MVVFTEEDLEYLEYFLVTYEEICGKESRKTLEAEINKRMDNYEKKHLWNTLKDIVE